MKKRSEMNEYEKAWDFINTVSASTDRNRIIPLKELVDKETPMKLTNIRPCMSEEGVVWGNCKCGNEIDFVKYLREVNYCSNCGQKIDWTDVIKKEDT